MIKAFGYHQAGEEITPEDASHKTQRLVQPPEVRKHRRAVRTAEPAVSKLPPTLPSRQPYPHKAYFTAPTPYI